MTHPQPNKLWPKIEALILPLVQWTQIDAPIALKAADVRAYLQKKGLTAGTSDCLIAATALVNDWVLVTRNTGHFKMIPDLQLENWFH